jgi:hypothetical protein
MAVLFHNQPRARVPIYDEDQKHRGDEPNVDPRGDSACTSPPGPCSLESQAATSAASYGIRYLVSALYSRSICSKSLAGSSGHRAMIHTWDGLSYVLGLHCCVCLGLGHAPRALHDQGSGSDIETAGAAARSGHELMVGQWRFPPLLPRCPEFEMSEDSRGCLGQGVSFGIFNTG